MVAKLATRNSKGNMPKIKSNLETTKAFPVIDEGWAQARIYQQPKVETPDRGAWQMQLDWELIGNQGEAGAAQAKWNGRKINFDNVIVGGINNNSGEPYALNRLLQYIGELGISYDCGSCNAANDSKPVRRGQDYFCPSCDSILTSIGYATEDFMGKVAMIHIGQEVQKTRDPDDPSKLIDAKNDDGTPLKRNRVKGVKALS